ncbi:hypothetical protein [Atopococcus tabaci]|uniref:hypothetical protein n=1 Tax=Atopococcus tabaci TaxID=269774 RepID=UPI0004221C4C|nr:hypothetical protein [Atopococcus tabaci]
MKTFLRLLSFEYERFKKFFAVLIGITLASNVIGIIYESRAYVSRANNIIYENQLTPNAYISQFGPMSMAKFGDTLWVMGPIALCIAALLFYSFFIWYREWYGRTTFAYRLLMLPVPRIQLFLSKLTVIFLAVLALVVLQLGLLWAGNVLMDSLVPSEFFLDMNLWEIVQKNTLLPVLAPESPLQFVIYYGLGLLFLIVLFTCILLERSYRGAGIVMAGLYGGAVSLFFISPLFVQLFTRGWFYDSELFLMMTGLGLLIAAGSLFFSSHLLRRKITV